MISMKITILEQKHFDDRYDLAKFHCNVLLMRKGDTLQLIKLTNGGSKYEVIREMSIDEFPSFLRQEFVMDSLGVDS